MIAAGGAHPTGLNKRQRWDISPLQLLWPAQVCGGVARNAVFLIPRVVTRSRFPATRSGGRPVRQTSLEDGAASCHDGAVFPKISLTTGTTQ
jgi:hypothetical protein